MDCREALSRIHASLDRELDSPRQQDLNDHLSGCAACHAEAASAAAFLGVIRERLRAHHTAPAGLGRRLEAALDGVDRSRLVHRLVVTTAASLLLTAALIFLLQRTRAIPPGDVIAATARSFAAIQRGELPLLVASSDPVDVTRTFRSRQLDVAVPGSILGSLEGAGCCALDCDSGELVPCIVFDWNGSKIGLWVFDERLERFSDTARQSLLDLPDVCFEIEGKRAIACVAPPIVHLWISDLDADALAAFVRKNDLPRPIPASAQRFALENLRCLACAAKLSEMLRSLPGVRDAWISLALSQAALLADRRIDGGEVAALLRRFGLGVSAAAASSPR